jgi:hypothetical protein
VTATLVRRRDWIELDIVAGMQGSSALEEPLREQAAQYWARAALLEHASIAAFSRFVLQLLSLAAPADLVDGAERAMADEIAHARACFALASSYGATLLGPGRLPTADCLGPCDLETVTRMVVREGCIGETLAAIEAAEALGHAQNESVRGALERIVADETRHAELAWRFIRWALERDPSLASAVSSELAAEERFRDAANVPTDQFSEASAKLAAHGVLPNGHGARLAARAVREVVRPLLQQVLEESRPLLLAQAGPTISTQSGLHSPTPTESRL